MNTYIDKAKNKIKMDTTQMPLTKRFWAVHLFLRIDEASLPAAG